MMKEFVKVCAYCLKVKDMKLLNRTYDEIMKFLKSNENEA